ncbi:MAG: diacylglycerol kinase family protein [Terriglobales bacterium]|jgi:YegS/Rv2252/BmrU family lipid kinase
MRKAALIYNPVSGPLRARRMAQIDAAAAVLRGAGIETVHTETHGPGTAGAQALEAVRAGCDAVLACGGDGTIHEVLQGMVSTPVALGVIPLGTANALAIDLGLPSGPAAAAQMLLNAKPVRVAAGKVTCQKDGAPISRYFTVAAGIGPDAHLMYQLNAQLKRKWGYPIYVAEALRTWATHKYPIFEAELNPTGSRNRVEKISQLLAVRITNFGNMLRRLAPGAALRRNDLRLVVFRTRSRMRYMEYMTAVLFGWQHRVRDIELLNASTVECRLPKGSAARIYVEADGELLGTLPAQLEIVRDAVTLLIP